MRVSPCPRTPDVKVLLEEVQSELTRLGRELGDLSKGLPDKHFLLTCLSTLCPNHRFFRSDYMPPIKHRKPQVKRDLPDYAALMVGLPPMTAKQVKKRHLKTHNKLLNMVHGKRESDADKEDGMSALVSGLSNIAIPALSPDKGSNLQRMESAFGPPRSALFSTMQASFPNPFLSGDKLDSQASTKPEAQLEPYTPRGTKKRQYAEITPNGDEMIVDGGNVVGVIKASQTRK